MADPKFVIRQNRLTRRWRVLLVGRNSEILSASETLNSVDAVNTNVQAQLDAIGQVKRVVWPS
jgi:hypothetical protein